MADDNRQGSLLNHLEALQDEVLVRLDELNARLEATLAQFSPRRERDVAEVVQN